MDKRVKYLLDEIERLDYNVQQEDENVYLISNFSPCGQDCNASIDTEDDAEQRKKVFLTPDHISI